MPCHSAVLKKIVSVGPDETIDKVLKEMKKAKVTSAAVVDGAGILLGIFSMKVLLKNLIPVSIAMADGVQLDIKISAAPGVAKRLANLKSHPVSEVMDRKPNVIFPDAPLWEGVSLLMKNGGPLVVADEKKKFHGIITYDSLLENLESIQAIDGVL